MGGPERVALVSMHTSPLDPPGRGDSGGMNVAILATARELARLGVAVELLARASGEARVIEISEGVTVRELAAGPTGPLAKEALGAASDAFGEAVAALAGRNGSGYDLVHAHYWRSGVAALPAALELGLPFVQSFHTLAVMKNRALAPGDTPEPEVRLRSEAFLSSQADALIAGSSTEAAALIDAVGAPAGKVWVVPPGVDTTLFTPARAISESLVRGRLRVDSDRPILVVAGRVQPLKGQELAIAALASMTGARPLLVIAGDPTPGAERFAHELRQLASVSGVDDDVRFTGALGRENLADLLAAASLVLVPSRSETFGLVALEAAASGTPVLATGAVGRTGAVAVGQSGVLLGSRDPNEWGNAIAGLLEDTLLLGELAASARDHAENFSWAASAAGLLGIYASLVDSPTGR
jgi:D-inositol-3-phosphate glycosyltransferase